MTDRIIPIVRASLPPARDLAAAPEGDLVDRRGRRVRDLRISVTDRCNFRCVYCMPKEVFDRTTTPSCRASSLLSFEEIERIARVFVDLGVEKIRITGGEPLLRKHIENLIERLAKLPVEITLTTNGSLLAKKARALKDAGLHRVTVSLDGIDDALQAHERRRLRRRRRARRHRRRGGRRPRADQGELRGQARQPTTTRSCRWRATSATGPHPALHRIHGRGQFQRLAHGRGAALRRGDGPHP
jgi:hypothetical protein